jgi:hypothetical protein
MEWCAVEGVKDFRPWRKNGMIRLFLNKKGPEISHVRLLKLPMKLRQPGSLHLDGALFTHGRLITRPIGTVLGGL